MARLCLYISHSSALLERSFWMPEHKKHLYEQKDCMYPKSFRWIMTKYSLHNIKTKWNEKTINDLVINMAYMSLIWHLCPQYYSICFQYDQLNPNMVIFVPNIMNLIPSIIVFVPTLSIIEALWFCVEILLSDCS